MSQAIVSYPEHSREAVVRRRLRASTGGLGWLSASDALSIIDRHRKAEAERKELDTAYNNEQQEQ